MAASLAAITLLAVSCTEKFDENTKSAVTGQKTETEPATAEETNMPETETEVITEETKPVRRTFQNPVSNESAPDPFVVYHDGYYYCLRTEVVQVRLYRSRTVEDVLINGEYKDLIKTGDPIFDDKTLGWNCWAPELHYMPTTGRWYVYFCACTNGFEFDSMRMICLESDGDDPFGNYTFKALTDPDLLAIDQTVWYDEASGEIYTVFSEFSSKGQVLTLAVMDNPWHVSDQRIMLSFPQYFWEKKGRDENNDGRVNEGPIFLTRDGKIYVLYSASGCWCEDYCLGMFTYTGDNTAREEFLKKENWKKERQPVFQKANKVYAPGHCSFFTSPDGSETWIAYHGMARPDAGVEGRYMYLQKIEFDENSVPVLGAPLSRDTVIDVPSGEE